MTAGSRIGFSANGRVARRSSPLLLLVVAGCMASGPADRADSPFAVATSDGAALVYVDGMATGVTNADLVRLIRAGVSDSYPTRCRVPSELAEHVPQLRWHLVSSIRWPVATLGAVLTVNGVVVNAASTTVAAPGADPAAVFEHDVSRLARRVLPRPALRGETCAPAS